MRRPPVAKAFCSTTKERPRVTWSILAIKLIKNLLITINFLINIHNYLQAGRQRNKNVLTFSEQTIKQAVYFYSYNFKDSWQNKVQQQSVTQKKVLLCIPVWTTINIFQTINIYCSYIFKKQLLHLTKVVTDTVTRWWFEPQMGPFNVGFLCAWVLSRVFFFVHLKVTSTV